MTILRKKNTWRAAVSVLTALILACMVTACGLPGSGSGGTGSVGTGADSGTAGAGGGTGTESGTAVIPQNSILLFDNDSGFARLRSDMESGDIPVECNVLYDVMGTRPDVTVKDEAMIREIYDRLSQVTVGEKSMSSVTDGYHHVSFHLRNDSFVSFYFEGESLFCWGYDNYYVSGADPLWSYVRQLQETVMEQERQKAANAGAGSSGGTTVASAGGQPAENKENKRPSSESSSKTVLDGKNPTADSGKNNSSGGNGLTGEVSAGNSENREISAQHAAGELTQHAAGEPARQSSGVAGGGTAVSQAESIPGSGQHADALQGTIPAPADTGTGQSGQDRQDEQPDTGVHGADSAADPAVQGGPQDGTAGTQPEQVPSEQTEPLSAEQPEQAPAEQTDPHSAEQPEQAPAEQTDPPSAEKPEQIPVEQPEQVPSEQTDPLQAERFAAMNDAYTEIVRAYAAVLSRDGTTFLQEYESGKYSTGTEAGQTGGTGDNAPADTSGQTGGTGDNAPSDAYGETGSDGEGFSGKNAMESVPTEAVTALPGAGAAEAAGQNAAADTNAADPRINYEMFREYFAHPDGSDVYFGLRDYNGDDTPELVIALGTAQFKHIWAGYTFNGQAAVPLFTGRCSLGYRVDLYTLSDNSFMIHGSGGAAAGRDMIARISAGGTGLEIIAEYEYDEQANGTMDHFGAAGTLSDEEFQQRFWADAKPAAEEVNFSAVRADASVQWQ